MADIGNGTVSIQSNRAFTLVLNGTTHLVSAGGTVLTAIQPDTGLSR